MLIPTDIFAIFIAQLSAFNFFISKYLKHILSAWNGFRSICLEFSISRNWNGHFPCHLAFLLHSLTFSLDTHLLNSLANKSWLAFRKTTDKREIFEYFSCSSHCGQIEFCGRLGFGLCLKAFVVKLICQWPGPISKWSSTRVANQVKK